MLTLLHRRQKRVHALWSIFSFALLLAIRKTDRIGRLLESAFRILDRIFLEHLEFVDLALELHHSLPEIVSIVLLYIE